MSEIVVVGSFTAQPGKEAEALQAFSALMEPTHGEEGCILYALHQGSDDPTRLAFVERWSSREALDAHLASAHVQEVLARAPQLFADGGDIVVYEARPGGETHKGSLAAHAGSAA
jgi:quinol monooxygenase YgiN